MLVPCSKCGRDVSKDAPACPDCGQPLATLPPVPPRWPPAPEERRGMSTSTGCTIIGLLVLFSLMFTCVLFSSYSV